MKYADLLVVDRDESEGLDWEVVLVPLGDHLFEPETYELSLTTLDARHLSGNAVFVRSVASTHVFRGAGTIHGLEPADLR
ncbi:MAG: hypothetical protein N2037_12160 [Acidimicrobiales bacterium]|nr:hypothetical protein [Acidimicrobiales bacterium]